MGEIDRIRQDEIMQLCVEIDELRARAEKAERAIVNKDLAIAQEIAARVRVERERDEARAEAQRWKELYREAQQSDADMERWKPSESGVEGG
jgi:hypothetical protein